MSSQASRSRVREALKVTGAAKSYGPVAALAGVDLEVVGGEFLTLLGPSGSGKTTLLNILAGFQQPDAGVVTLGGRDITATPAHRRGFGIVFQSYALFPHMNVAENVGYPLRMRHVGRSERVAQVREYLDLVELGELGGRYPHELSGGQQQRVALARALVFRPDVLLMDEPLGALDRRLRQALQFEIRRLHTELGPTIVYVTHDQEEALSMSDRIAVMSEGRIVQIDGPQSVYEEPASAFVATFLGETNFLPVAVEPSADGRAVVRHLPSGGVVSLDVAADLGPGQMSIRPEHLDVRPLSEGAPGFAGRVTEKTFMGDMWRYECQIAEDTVVAHSPVREPNEARVGDQVALIPIEPFVVIFGTGGERRPSAASNGRHEAQVGQVSTPSNQ